MPAITRTGTTRSDVSSIAIEGTPRAKQDSVLPDLDAELWYDEFRPMLEKLLRHSRYSPTRQDDVLAFFASNMAPFLGQHHTRSARPWRSFMTLDNTPVEPSLAWCAARPEPRTRLAIDIIPASGATDTPSETAQRSLQFTQNLKVYAEGPNPVAITGLDLALFYAIANVLFVPIPDAGAADLIARLPSGPSLTFFGIDIEERNTKVKAYFIPGLTAAALGQEVHLTALITTTLEILREDPNLALEGKFQAWEEIVTYFGRLPTDQVPRPFILSVDCVQESKARCKVYFRCRCRCPEDLKSIMSLGGLVPLAPGHFEAVKALWDLLLPSDTTLDSQSVLAESGLCVYYDFRASSALPAVKVYLPVQNWVSNDLKAANAIAKWLKMYVNPESARTYVQFVAGIWYVLLWCAPTDTHCSAAERDS